MKETKTLFDQSEKSKPIPPHDCKKNLRIISQTHSVNSLHNIVIAQTKQCEILRKEVRRRPGRYKMLVKQNPVQSGKVYESSHQTRRDYKKVPQIKTQP